MKLIAALVLLAISLSGCATLPRKVALEPSGEFPPPGTVVEHMVDLGFGFKEVTLAEPVHVDFESIGHFGYLYYGKQRLSRIDKCSVSPSGKYAIYQGPKGKLFLFCRADDSLTQLTDRSLGYADSFQWHEDAKTVEVDFTFSWKSKRKFPIQ